MDTVVDVVHHIRATPDSDVAISVIEAMTTNETLWFRDVRPFRVLRQELLPAVLERNQVRRRLSVWSAASSTGQEIYSVALMLKHDFPQLNDWNVSLVGTDINGTVLEKARTGRFSTLEINRGLPAALTARDFRRDGSQYVIEDSVRKLVSLSNTTDEGRRAAASVNCCRRVVGVHDRHLVVGAEVAQPATALAKPVEMPVEHQGVEHRRREPALGQAPAVESPALHVQNGEVVLHVHSDHRHLTLGGGHQGVGQHGHRLVQGLPFPSGLRRGDPVDGGRPLGDRATRIDQAGLPVDDGAAVHPE